MKEYKRFGLTEEIKAILQAGGVQVTIATLDTELSKLGYRRELDSRCACIAHNLTTGNHYPCVTYGVKEVDTGMSAFHFEARRDVNFIALQALRLRIFAVAHGKLVTI